MSADVERQDAVVRQRPTYRVDRGVRRERGEGWPQHRLELLAMLGERSGSPGVSTCGQGGEARERGIEIAGCLMHELHGRRDVDRLDVDLKERHFADPGLVLDL